MPHACEVVCRGHGLAKWVTEGVRPGQPVTVDGELTMLPMQGPLEDDLSGVRTWSVAGAVRLAEEFP